MTPADYGLIGVQLKMSLTFKCSQSLRTGQKFVKKVKFRS